MSAWELMQMENEEVIGIYGDLPPPALSILPAIAATPPETAKDTSAEFVDPDSLV